MPHFQYVGRNSQGHKIKAFLEASTLDEAAALLLSRKITPLSINETESPGPTSTRTSLPASEKKWFQRSLSLDELAIFSANMAVLVGAGVPIVSAAQQLALMTTSKLFRQAIERIAEELEAGQSLALSIKHQGKIFPPIFANLIEVGEASGQLETAFNQLAGYLRHESEVKKRLKAALRYPKLVMTALLCAMVIVNVFVVPAFTGFFKSLHRQLPWPTQLLINVSDFFIHYWLALLILLTLIFLLTRSYVATAKGRYVWDRYKLRLPIFGELLSHILLTRFAWAFSLILKSGVPLLQGLSLVAESSNNRYMGNKIEDIRRHIESGRSLSQSMTETRLFNPLMMQMISVGEESGKTADMFERIAETFERDTDYTIQHFSDLLEPTLLVCLGAMVLVLALGIFLPMFSLVGT